MNLTDTAFVISSRCRLIPDQALDLLKYFDYIGMGSTERQDFTDTVMFLSVRGFDQNSIQQTIVKAQSIRKTFGDIMNDPIFADKKKDGPFLALNINDTEAKSAIKKLSNAGISASAAGKSLGKAMLQIGDSLKNFRRLPNINQCKWLFKGKQCGYNGPAVSCNNTFESCSELGNQEKFGGFSPEPKKPGFKVVYQEPAPGQIEFMYADDEPRKNVGEITKMWVDDRVIYEAKEERAPEGIDQDDWDVMSTKSKSFILKRLGYNRKKKEDINRAIDL